MGTSAQRLGLAGFFVVVLGPVFFLALDAARSTLLAETSLTWNDFPISRYGPLLFRTVLFALLVAGGATAIGLLSATAFWRWPERSLGVLTARWGRRAVLLTVTFLAVPPYVHALAWTEAGRGLGMRLENAPAEFSGWLAAWWVEVMAYLPISVTLGYLGLASIDPIVLDAARMQRSDFTSLLRIVWPLAAPYVLAAGAIVYTLSLTDYGIPLLFQKSVYSLELYVVYSGGAAASEVFVAALPLIVLAMTGIICAQRGLRAATSKPVWGSRWSSFDLALPSWFRALTGAALLVTAGQVAVPLVMLSLRCGSVANLLSAASGAQRELLNSVVIALATGAACLPLAWAAARVLERNDTTGRMSWLLVTLSLAIPPPLIGIGLALLWNHASLDAVYGTIAMPVLASLARFAPAAALVMLAQRRRVDPLLFDAAAVHRKSPLAWRTQVVWPMLASGLLAAAGMASALSFGELGATLIVAPPGRATLAMRIFSYLHFGAGENVAALCLLMALGTLAASLLTLGGLHLWSRLFSRRERP